MSPMSSFRYRYITKPQQNMTLRIVPMEAYDGCIPVTVWMVQKRVGHFPFDRWVNIKGYSDKKKAVELMSLLNGKK